MALFNWLGGTGPYTAARLWSPRGAPGAGDTAAVGTGEVVVQGRSLEATVVLGGTNAAAQPVPDLRNATLAALTMPDDLPAAPYTTYAPQTAPAEYGTVNVRGHSSIGHIGLGDFAGRRCRPGTARCSRTTPWRWICKARRCWKPAST